MARSAAAALLLAACYHPTILAGSPCESSRDCPGDLECVSHVCGGDAAIDAPPIEHIEVGGERLRDTEIWIMYPTTNYGTQDHTSVDLDETALIWFDLTAIEKTVVGATMTIETDSLSAATDGGTVTVHRLREGWLEAEATWTLRSASQAWSVEGAQPPARDATPVATFSPDQLATRFEVELPVELVQAWIAEPATNFGLALVRGTTLSHIHFVSRDVGGGATLELDLQ